MALKRKSKRRTRKNRRTRRNPIYRNNPVSTFSRPSYKQCKNYLLKNFSNKEGSIGLKYYDPAGLYKRDKNWKGRTKAQIRAIPESIRILFKKHFECFDQYNREMGKYKQGLRKTKPSFKGGKGRIQIPSLRKCLDYLKRKSSDSELSVNDFKVIPGGDSFYGIGTRQITAKGADKAGWTLFVRENVNLAIYVIDAHYGSGAAMKIIAKQQERAQKRKAEKEAKAQAAKLKRLDAKRRRYMKKIEEAEGKIAEWRKVLSDAQQKASLAGYPGALDMGASRRKVRRRKKTRKSRRKTRR